MNVDTSRSPTNGWFASCPLGDVVNALDTRVLSYFGCMMIIVVLRSWWGYLPAAAENIQQRLVILTIIIMITITTLPWLLKYAINSSPRLHHVQFL